MKYCIFILLCFSGCAFPGSTGADESFPGEIRGLQIDPNPASEGDTIKFNLDFALLDTTVQNVEYFWSISGGTRTRAFTSTPEFSWVVTNAPRGEYRCHIIVSAPVVSHSASKGFTFLID